MTMPDGLGSTFPRLASVRGNVHRSDPKCGPQEEVGELFLNQQGIARIRLSGDSYNRPNERYERLIPYSISLIYRYLEMFNVIE